MVAGTGTELRDSVVRVLRRMAVQAVLVADTDEVDGFQTVRALDDRLPARAAAGALAELRGAIARHLTARSVRLGQDAER